MQATITTIIHINLKVFSPLSNINPLENKPPYSGDIVDLYKFKFCKIIQNWLREMQAIRVQP